MKRIIIMFLSFILVLSCVGCGGNNEKQEALLQYINTDLVEMVEIETALLESYDSVTGTNYTDDFTMYTEMTSNTATLARDLNDKALDISQNISDEEILNVHRIYMNYASAMSSAISITISALECQDYAQISQANEKINEANMLGLDFQSALTKLAEEYGVEIE